MRHLIQLLILPAALLLNGCGMTAVTYQEPSIQTIVVTKTYRKTTIEVDRRFGRPLARSHYRKPIILTRDDWLQRPGVPPRRYGDWACKNLNVDAGEGWEETKVCYHLIQSTLGLGRSFPQVVQCDYKNRGKNHLSKELPFSRGYFCKEEPPRERSVYQKHFGQTS